MSFRRAWYFVRSFAVSSRSADDYPVYITEQEPGVGDEADRLRIVKRYCARIEGWTTMYGFGDSAAEARADLDAGLKSYARDKQMPRPGSKVRISFASTRQLDTLADLKDDFIERVLRLPPSQTFISDVSELSMFPEEREEYGRRTLLLYGLDLDSLPNDRLVTILKAIATGRP